jgi:hypothetical protein
MIVYGIVAELFVFIPIALYLLLGGITSRPSGLKIRESKFH